MKVLAIESSCDETAVSIVEDGHNVLANLVASQINKHAAFGGVIPELAAREHLKAIKCLTEQALDDSGLSLEDLDAIAVTQLPGLIPALLVGINYAKGLASAIAKPLIGVNHIIAHIFGAFIDDQEALSNADNYPMLSLIVSGGHTHLVLIEQNGSCKVVGQTLDDAAGEAFDKAAKILELPYPGGPVIDRIAKEEDADPQAFDFPRAMCPKPGQSLKPENRLNFSFSGVKTALLYQVRDPSKDTDFESALDIDEALRKNLVASFQEAVVDALVIKTAMAAEDYSVKSIVLCGGVACNSRLRQKMSEKADFLGLPLFIAPPKYCTDNAAMIGGLACYQYKNNDFEEFNMDASARLKGIDSVPFTMV